MVLLVLTTIYSPLPTIVYGPPLSLTRFEGAALACKYPRQSVVRGVFNGRKVVMLPASPPSYAASECARKWLHLHPDVRPFEPKGR